MAIFIQFTHLIIQKSAVENVAHLKESLGFNAENDTYEEDDFLLSFPISMNLDKNLDVPYYQEKLGLSKRDFVFVSAYQNPTEHWEVDWLKSVGNMVAWHKDEKPERQEKLKELEYITIDELERQYGSLFGFFKAVEAL